MSNKNLTRPILASIVLFVLLYIKIQKVYETSLMDYVLDAAIVILLLGYAEEIVLLLVYSPFIIIEKFKNFKHH